MTGLDQSGFTSLVHGLRTVFTEEHSDREKGGHQSKTAFYQEGGRSKWPWGRQPTGVLWSHGWRPTGLVKEEDGRGILGEDNKDFPGGSEGKAPACKAGDLCSIPGSGRSPGEMATHSSTLASLVGYSPQAPKELDMTGAISLH